jgi:hypothetical protein
MNPWEVIRNLERLGLSVTVEDGQLQVRGRGATALPAATRQLLADHRDQFVECLESRQQLADALTEDIERADSHDQLELTLERTNDALRQEHLTGSQVEALARRMVSRARRLHRPPAIVYTPSLTA